MCEMASALINPRTLDVKVWDLTGHSKTREALGLPDDAYAPDRWREMHYLPDGRVTCRVLDIDSHTAAECEASVLARWPTFWAFFSWACERLPDGYWDGEYLYLDSVTSLDGVTLPAGLTELSLRGTYYTGADLSALLDTSKTGEPHV